MTNGKKISQKKKRKAQWMWLEQVFYKIDAISERLNKIESDVNELRKLYKELRGQINKVVENNKSDSNGN